MKFVSVDKSNSLAFFSSETLNNKKVSNTPKQSRINKDTCKHAKRLSDIKFPDERGVQK